MKLAKTMSTLCLACVLSPLLGAAPATQPGASSSDVDVLKQRIAQLEAENADLRAKLERASKGDAAKSSLALNDELKIDYVVPPTPREPINATSMIRTVSGTGTITELRGANAPTTGGTLRNVPVTQKRILDRPPGDLIDDRQPQKP